MEKIKEWFEANKKLAIGLGVGAVLLVVMLMVTLKKKAAIKARMAKARRTKARNQKSGTTVQAQRLRNLAKARAARAAKRKTK